MRSIGERPKFQSSMALTMFYCSIGLCFARAVRETSCGSACAGHIAAIVHASISVWQACVLVGVALGVSGELV